MKILNSQHAVLDTQESLEFNLLIYQLQINLEEEGSESFHFYTKKKTFHGNSQVFWFSFMRRGRPLHRQALFRRSRFGSRRLLRTLHRGQPVDSNSELTECSLILGKRKKQTLPQLSPQLTAPTSVCLPASSVVSGPPLSPLIDKLESFNKQNHSIKIVSAISKTWFEHCLSRVCCTCNIK